MVTRQHLLFLWWRTWHLRNDVIFGNGKATIEDSATFIANYSTTMENLQSDDETILCCLGGSNGTKDRLSGSAMDGSQARRFLPGGLLVLLSMEPVGFGGNPLLRTG